MKFTLIANANQYDGFKLSFQAENESEVKICQELAEKLIEKIEKISIEIGKEY